MSETDPDLFSYAARKPASASAPRPAPQRRPAPAKAATAQREALPRHPDEDDEIAEMVSRWEEILRA